MSAARKRKRTPWENAEFVATMTSSSVLKRVVEAVKDLIPKANFIVCPEYISMQSMDSSHVALVALLLDASSPLFSEYRCSRTRTLGFDLIIFSQVLNCVRDDSETVTLWFNPTPAGAEGPDVLNLYFENQRGDCNKSFAIKLQEIEADELVIPTQEYSATVTVPSDKWKQDLLSFEALKAETVELRSENGKFFVSPMGNFSVDLTVEYDLRESNSDGLELLLKAPCKEQYALKLLKTFTKASAFSPTVCIELHPMVPSSFEYGNPGVGFIRFFLAPKIADEPLAEAREFDDHR